MLTIQNRHHFQTLHNAITLNGGDEIAVIFIETGKSPITITRAHFIHKARKYGIALQKQGIQATDLVFIAHQNILDSIYAFWGAILIGAIPSMFPTLTDKLDPEIYSRSLAKLVDFSDAKAIVTADSYTSYLQDIVSCPIISIETSEKDTEVVSPTITAQSIAFLQHSSGTTGLQKGVALSHEAVLNQLASYSDAIALSPDDVIVSWLPLYHDMGLIAGFLLPIVQGIPLILMSPFDWIAHPAMLLEAIHYYSATLCWLPNFAYNHMARRIRQRDSDSLSLGSVRAFINCSEPVRHDSHQKFLERFAECGLTESQFAVSYAMAENSFAVTQTYIGEYPTVDIIDSIQLQKNNIAKSTKSGMKVVSCGTAIQNTNLKIINDDGEELAEREVGEIYVQSDCMLREYHHRPDLKPFSEGWYQTGDMGYIAQGEIYIVGRKKDLIITAGKNVYPQDIEAIVNTIDGVHDGRCVIFGIPNEREGTELIVVVAELEPTDNIDEKLVKKAIRQAIAQQSTVSASFITFVQSKWLIKTSSGKIARDANRRKWIQEFHKSS